MSNKSQSLYDGMQSSQIEQRFKISIKNKLYQTYGDAPDDQISLRFQEEWAAMEQSNTILDVVALYELTTWLKENNHPYQIRGCVGASFILYLLEITSGISQRRTPMYLDKRDSALYNIQNTKEHGT